MTPSVILLLGRGSLPRWHPSCRIRCAVGKARVASNVLGIEEKLHLPLQFSLRLIGEVGRSFGEVTRQNCIRRNNVWPHRTDKFFGRFFGVGQDKIPQPLLWSVVLTHD